MQQEDARIPHVPDQSQFINTWHDWHRGYRIIANEGGREERQELRGQNLRHVDIGHLPIPDEDISVYDERAIPWVVSASSVEVSSTPAQRVEIVIPEEDRLFDDEPIPTGESRLDHQQTHGSVSADQAQATRSPIVEGRVQPPNEVLSLGLNGRELSQLRSVLQRFQNLATGMNGANHRLGQFTTRLVDMNGPDVGFGDLRIQMQELQANLNRASAIANHVLADSVPASARYRRSLSSLDNTPRPQALSTAAERMTRVFGTREDVQRSDYVSPIGAMFERHRQRYEYAEQLRRNGSDTSNIPLFMPQPRLERLREQAGSTRVQTLGGQPDQTSEPLNDHSLFSSSSSIFRSLQDAVSSIATLNASGHEGRVTANSQFRSRLAPPPRGLRDEEMFVKMKCSVCQEQVADIALVPCGHMVMCRWCSELHEHYIPENRRIANSCPMCRTTIKQRVWI